MKREKRIQFMTAALPFILAVLLGACSGGGAVYELADGTASGSSPAKTSDPDTAMSGDAESDSAEEPASSPGESGDGGQPLEPETIADSSAPEDSAKIQVYICGAVASPGVYELPGGSRVVQALELAGGLLPEADEKTLNQARLLADGEQITVWTKEEAEELGVTADSGPAAGADGAGTTADGGRVNLNTATKEELMTLPGVGESRADAILRYREEHGGFSGIEEVMNIEGIKEKMFEKIKGSIEV